MRSSSLYASLDTILLQDNKKKHHIYDLVPCIKLEESVDLPHLVAERRRIKRHGKRSVLDSMAGEEAEACAIKYMSTTFVSSCCLQCHVEGHTCQWPS